MLQIQFEIFDLQNEKYNINMNFNPQDKQTTQVRQRNDTGNK
jgi:hypothetical protein